MIYANFFETFLKKTLFSYFFAFFFKIIWLCQKKVLPLQCEIKNNAVMSDLQIDKLSEILREHFNLFHADMICRAVQDGTISVEDFKLGVLAIKSAENVSLGDEFTPQQFQNV